MTYIPREIKTNPNVSSTSPLKELILLLGGIIGFLVIGYFLLGLAVEKVVQKLPPQIEQNLGKAFANLYQEARIRGPAEEKLSSLLTDLVEKFPPEERKRRNYHLWVVSNPVVNALALPGGKIIIFSGLLKEIESENEISMILGHELGHFVHRDHLKGLGRWLVLLFLSSLILGENNFITGFLENALLGVEARLSQEQEIAADLFGLDLLNKKYGHCAGATDFFEKMKERKKNRWWKQLLSTHPTPQTRIANLKKQIAEKNYSLGKKIPWKFSQNLSPPPNS
jgi:Zn-dependent protease with chaperone function